MPEGKFTLKQYCEEQGVPISTARSDFNILEELEAVAIYRGPRGKANIIESIGINISAFMTLTWSTNPSADARIALQVSKSDNGGTNPSLYGVQLFWS